MSLCDTSISPLQRRSLRTFGLNLVVAVALLSVTRYYLATQRPSQFSLYALSAAAALPILNIMRIVARYLKRESDEYVRMLVVQSLLWGLGVTMVANTIFGVLSEYFVFHGLLQLANLDLFCVTAMAALRLQLWQSR